MCLFVSLFVFLLVLFFHLLLVLKIVFTCCQYSFHFVFLPAAGTHNCFLPAASIPSCLSFYLLLVLILFHLLLVFLFLCWYSFLFCFFTCCWYSYSYSAYSSCSSCRFLSSSSCSRSNLDVRILKKGKLKN